MHLSDVLNEDMVWPALSSNAREEVIRELAEGVAQHEATLDADMLYGSLIEREKLGSTGIESGVAIPHAKVPGLTHIVVACGRSVEGLDFNAHDAKPTHLFFVLLAPLNATGMHLKVLARLSRLLKEARVRNRLMEARESHEMYNIIIEEDDEL